MGSLINIIIWPFAWLLAQFLELCGHNYGLALILFTLVTRILLIPMSVKQQKGMLIQAKYAPKIKEIQEKYADDKNKASEETMKFYKEVGYSPFSGCLPLLLQMPIILILYNVIQNPLQHILGLGKNTITAISTAMTGITGQEFAANSQLQLVKSAQTNFEALIEKLPEVANISEATMEKIANINLIDFNFLGLDLSLKPSLAFNALLLIPVFAAATAFVQSIISQKFSAASASPEGAPANKSMLYVGPIISLIFSFSFPAGIGLYWIAGNIFAIGQSYILGKIYNPKAYVEKIKEEEAEKKRILKQIEKEKRAAAYEKKAMYKGKKKKK